MSSSSSFRMSKLFILFLILWGCINLIQAYFTNLHYDEAYYWLWSKYPAWGYFDHPPMIAMMIRAGYAVFSNELGVRLLTVLSQVGALIIVWSMLDPEKRKNPEHLLILSLIIASLPLMNVYGFIATPDSPMLFFSALFLYFYRKFIKDQSWTNVLFLGLSMSGLVYSKYHGILMIIFVIFSNLKLLRSPKFWIASIFAILLFVPHILWQFSNDFPSLRFHLADRASGFELKNIPEYLLNQLVINNPLLFPLMLWLIFRKRSSDEFERTLRFITAGIMIFFLLSAFRYHVEPQWTAIITFPLLILFFNTVEFKPGISRYIRWTSSFIIPVILIARIAIAVNFIPVRFLEKEFHDPEKWTKEIATIAGERPVVFTNSYHDASLYAFYTGHFVHSLDNKDYRKTQFDLWDFEEQLHGKEVFYKPHWLNNDLKKLLSVHAFPSGDTLYYSIFKDFQSLQRDCIKPEKKNYEFSNSKSNEIDLKIFNPYPYPIILDHPVFPVSFEVIFSHKGKLSGLEKCENMPEKNVINPGDTIAFRALFYASDIPEGEYSFAIGTSVGILFDAANSRFTRVSMTK